MGNGPKETFGEMRRGWKKFVWKFMRQKTEKIKLRERVIEKGVSRVNTSLKGIGHALISFESPLKFVNISLPDLYGTHSIIPIQSNLILKNLLLYWSVLGSTLLAWYAQACLTHETFSILEVAIVKIRPNFPLFFFVKCLEANNTNWKCRWRGFIWMVTSQDFIHRLKN